MKLKTVAALTAALVSTPSLFAQDSASDLIEEHTKKAAEALEAYLQENPEADDAIEAIDFLIGAYARLDVVDRQTELMVKKYDSLPKGKDLEPQEFFGIYQELFGLYMRNGKKEEAKAAMAKARSDIEGHPQADRFAQFIDQMGGQLRQPAVGDTMEIKFTSLQGEEIDLAKMSDKVVLIDFWATWCGPCVRELPNVLEAYQEYHDKGFEIIGISLDKAEDKAKLEEFIKTREMPWPQAFDGGGWKAGLAEKFGINSIPATFLVGKDGKIVATNLRGSALSNRVKKELGL